VAACFPSASVANCSPGRCFLIGKKRGRSRSPTLPTRLIMALLLGGYGPPFLQSWFLTQWNNEMRRVWKETFIVSFMTSRNATRGTKECREEPRPRKALWDLRFKTKSYGTPTARRRQSVKQVVLSGLPFPKIMSVC